MHLSCQRSPDKCFENRSRTQYDVTVHYVRTHTILTFLAFFNFSVYFIWLCWVLFLPVWQLSVLLQSCPTIIALSSLSSSYMPLNSAASSLARSVDNTVVAVLLTVALALLIFMVVGLLAFSLVEFMSSAVVELAVLEFS